METIQAGIADLLSQSDFHRTERTIDLLKVIFGFARAPVYFDDLLVIVAETQNIKDQREISPAEVFSLQVNTAFSENKTLTEIQQQENLKRVWTEIAALPVRHRLALLLNLKDKQGDGVIRLFPILCQLRPSARSPKRLNFQLKNLLPCGPSSRGMIYKSPNIWV